MFWCCFACKEISLCRFRSRARAGLLAHATPETAQRERGENRRSYVLNYLQTMSPRPRPGPLLLPPPSSHVAIHSWQKEKKETRSVERSPASVYGTNRREAQGREDERREEKKTRRQKGRPHKPESFQMPNLWRSLSACSSLSAHYLSLHAHTLLMCQLPPTVHRWPLQ